MPLLLHSWGQGMKPRVYSIVPLQARFLIGMLVSVFKEKYHGNLDMGHCGDRSDFTSRLILPGNSLPCSAVPGSQKMFIAVSEGPGKAAPGFSGDS